MENERNKLLPSTEEKYIVMFDDDDYYASDSSEGKGCALWSVIFLIAIIAGVIFLFT